METIYLIELLSGFFGPSWLATGWEKMNFIAPVSSGETVSAPGVITGESRDSQGARLGLKIWCENSEGRMTAASWASAEVE